MRKKIEWYAVVDGVRTDDPAKLPQLDYRLLELWIERVASRMGRLTGELVYLFCDDDYILETNRSFLNHDYYTDIITFDYCRGKLLRGDMVISTDTVRSNAGMLGVKADRELCRVIIHGVLHLCGIDDKGPGAREIMEAHENKSLALLDELKREQN